MIDRILHLFGLIFLFLIVGLTVYVSNSYSTKEVVISDMGSHYISAGSTVKTNGITCLNTYDYTNSPFKTTSDNTCSSTRFNLNNTKNNYLVVLKEANKSCSSNGSIQMRMANCYVYNYTIGSYKVGCNKNNINAGDSASCTLKLKTSSDGIKKISFKPVSSDLRIANIESQYFNDFIDDDTYVFVSKDNMTSDQEYIAIIFDIVNRGENDGLVNTISFNDFSYTDSIANLNLSSQSLTFTENYVEPTTKKTTTISPKIDDGSKTITSGIEEGKKDNGIYGINGSMVVLLVVFVVLVSIASGIGIVLLVREKETKHL